MHDTTVWYDVQELVDYEFIKVNRFVPVFPSVQKIGSNDKNITQ